MPRTQSNPVSRISVALCTFNAGRFLKPQLDSILAQARLPDELIICDDRSDDGTVDVIKAFAKQAPFPVEIVVNPERLGSTKNYEKAIGLAHGDVIALSDQDDVWRINKLERIESEFSRSDRVGVVFSDARLVDAAQRFLGASLWQSIGFTRREQARIRTGRAFDVLLRHNVVTGATMAFAARLREIALPIPAAWVHDGWIAVLAATESDVIPISETLIDYRQHAGSQIGAGTLGIKEIVLRAGESRRVALEDTAVQYESLHEHLAQQATLSGRTIERLRGKIEHMRARAGLPVSRLSRIPHITSELVRGRYGRYSRGIKDVIKDIARTENGPS